MQRMNWYWYVLHFNPSDAESECKVSCKVKLMSNLFLCVFWVVSCGRQKNRESIFSLNCCTFCAAMQTNYTSINLEYRHFQINVLAFEQVTFLFFEIEVCIRCHSNFSALLCSKKFHRINWTFGTLTVGVFFNSDFFSIEFWAWQIRLWISFCFVWKWHCLFTTTGDFKMAGNSKISIVQKWFALPNKVIAR